MVSSSQAQPVSFEAYILGASSSSGTYFYQAHTGDRVITFSCPESFHPGDIVSGEWAGGVTTGRETTRMQPPPPMQLHRIERLGNGKDSAALSRIESRLASSFKSHPWTPLSSDPDTPKLAPMLLSAFGKLLAARTLQRFMFFKYHHDADGISAALAMLSFLPGKAVQQNSAVYNAREAVRDLATFQYETRPLVVLLDLGSGGESAEGLALLKAAGVETIVIDHHPVAPVILPLVSIMVNPWLLDLEAASHSKSEGGLKAEERPGPESRSLRNPGDCESRSVSRMATQHRESERCAGSLSRFSAGYLACELARLAGCPEDVLSLAQISCAGDKSDILPLRPEDHERALVLDYLAMNAGSGNLPFYKKTLGNPELFRSLVRQAEEKIGELAHRAQEQWKTRKYGDLTVYTVDLGALLKGNEFHSKGKIATALLELQRPQDPVIILGYDERTIVLRATAAAVAEGFSLAALIEKVKPSMASFIESGGGHAKASAIRCRQGFAKDVSDAFLKLLEQ